MKRILTNYKKNIVVHTTVIFTALLFSISILYSCGANIFSVEDDVQIGRDVDREIKSRPNEFPMLKGHQDIKDYINGLGRYVLNNSNRIKYKNVFPYTFQVVNDTIVNAFCTPGGFIYIYTGLMKFLDNEASLVGVIGHEIAHAERRHMTQRLTAYYGVSAIMSLILGGNPNIAAEIAANLFVGLGFLANSRSDEEEADNYSIRYLATTKYYPGSISFFFDKIKEEQKKKGTTPGDLSRLLSTHPLPQDRIDNVHVQLKKLKLNADPTKGLFTEQYQRMKAKLP
jgi:predicted Zn-dependent protease